MFETNSKEVIEFGRSYGGEHRPFSDGCRVSKREPAAGACGFGVKPGGMVCALISYWEAEAGKLLSARPMSVM